MRQCLQYPRRNRSPPFRSDVEKGFWLRSRFAPRLDVQKQYDSPLRSLRPCQKTFLNIFKISDSAIGYMP